MRSAWSVPCVPKDAGGERSRGSRRARSAVDLLPALRLESAKGRIEDRPRPFGQLYFDGLLADQPPIGQPDSIGRQHAGMRVHEDPGDAKGIGHEARVLRPPRRNRRACIH